MATRQDIVLAGLPVALEAFNRLAPDSEITVEATDGDRLILKPLRIADDASAAAAYKRVAKRHSRSLKKLSR